ncbi:Rab-GTPase-TBC domain containing protein [Trypanosoma brucei equiperdum]|uniref:Rab-GTPase-TBC domain containing protein n=1 Tax=Trypanosoma brucei equiperdum TaxID=630700 RepID=A0A3L6L466_9TRYP|nr:Rab-GTPase-TBC domain containing protein [Trypanosoma brucei equiperdum]
MMTKTYGSKNPSSNVPLHLAGPPPFAFSDGRAPTRGNMRSFPTPSSAGLSSSVHLPPRSQGSDRRSFVLSEISGASDQLLRTLHRELCNLSAHTESGVSRSCRGESTNRDSASPSRANITGHGLDEQAPISQLSSEEVRTALSLIIHKQNLDLKSRHQRLRQLAEENKKGDTMGTSSDGGVLNEPCCLVLHRILAEARRRWMRILSSRVQGLKKELPVREHPQSNDAHTTSGVSNANALDDSISDVDSDEEMEWSVEHLYETLVSGLNSTVTEELIVTEILGGDTTALHDGIDAFGLLTVFRAPVQAMLVQHQEALAPSLSTLRQYFAALHPSAGCPRAHGSASRAAACSAYSQLNDFLNPGGSTPKSVAAALRRGASPSMRRLLYARALQLQLVVLEGGSTNNASGELHGSNCGDVIGRCVSFGTSRNLESMRRRVHHKYAVKGMEVTVKVLQAVVKVDNMQSVGDSDRYFIFLDETEALGTTLIVDKDVSDVHLKSTLAQLGRPPEQIESYLVYLLHADVPSADAGQQRTQQQHQQTKTQHLLPSGFFPVEKCTLLIAPVCYITGDTTEQYSLVVALFGQLWCRLQGPTPELAQCCWIFESLVVRFAAPACLHATRALRYPPLRLALRWMMTAFADVLEPNELLNLWDLVLSYHIEEVFSGHTSLSLPMCACGRSRGSQRLLPAPCALWLLPIVAASIFVYRAPLVERCGTAEEMLLLFTTGHHLRCRPLLQYLLFMAK